MTNPIQLEHNTQQSHGFSLLKHIIEAFPDGVFTLNHLLIISYANPAFCTLMGFKKEELIGTEITEYLGDLNILAACHAEVLEKGSCRDQETTFKRRDGSLVNISKNVQLLLDEEGKPGFIVSIRDLTQVHELNKELARSAKELEHYNQNLSAMVASRTQSLHEQMAFLSSYKKALDTSSLVSKYDLNDRVTEVNRALCELLGYSEAEYIGRESTCCWNDESQLKFPDIKQHVVNGKTWTGRIVFNTREGKSLHFESCIVPILDESGEVRELVNISYDITPLVQSTNTLTYRLFHDSLTGFSNRNKLLADIEKSVNKALIVLFNIDSFNEINSFYGHEIADQLLKEVALRLQQLVTGMPITLYKLPVDEYALVIQQDWDQDEFERFVYGILLQISSEGFDVGNAHINVTLTAGMASSLKVGEPVKDVLIAADMALKMAKKQHKDYVFYKPDLNIKQGYESNLIWIQRLRDAMDEDRLVPFYQPIVNTHTLEIERYECLVRIVEDDGTVVSPYYFLDVAKKLKLYSQLTKRMIDKSFAKFAEQPYAFSINLSIEDIDDPSISNWVLEKVRNCDFAERVIFEIVESEGIQNYDVVNRFIQEVKRYGVQIAIDDFGAGYSNFAYIMRLDVDFIKIDGSIIRDIHKNPSSQVITETILDFAGKLNIQTVAEFVADEEVYNYVKNLSVDSLQGYLFGEPLADLLPA